MSPPGQRLSGAPSSNMPSTKSSFVRFAYCRSGRKVINGNLRAESARPAQGSVLEVSQAFLNEPRENSTSSERINRIETCCFVFFTKSGTFFRARRVHAQRPFRIRTMRWLQRSVRSSNGREIRLPVAILRNSFGWIGKTLRVLWGPPATSVSIDRRRIQLRQQQPDYVTYIRILAPSKRLCAF
ncbi:hypothetical protein ABID19_004368 [Mesorhizobium robiniae]|uniref:Uncharacterized protein n=1 Tax=Mesorhizobium robiniae TaxID=559315 RepID=A0ABV2GSQ4_9HYPH